MKTSKFLFEEKIKFEAEHKFRRTRALEKSHRRILSDTCDHKSWQRNMIFKQKLGSGASVFFVSLRNRGRCLQMLPMAHAWFSDHWFPSSLVLLRRSVHRLKSSVSHWKKLENKMKISLLVFAAILAFGYCHDPITVESVYKRARYMSSVTS